MKSFQRSANRLLAGFAAGLLALIGAGSSATAAEIVQSIAANPSYSPGNCITNLNGWGGSDTVAFTAPYTGSFQLIKLQAGGSAWTDWWAMVDPATYDPSVNIFDQAIGYGSPNDPSEAAMLEAGQDVSIVIFYNGGYGDLASCESDGSTQAVTGDVLGTEPIPVPALGTGALMLLTLLLGSAALGARLGMFGETGGRRSRGSFKQTIK